MKKVLIAASALMLICSVTSCDQIKKNLSQNEQKKINPFSVNSGDENRDIVTFNNKVVKKDNEQASFITKMDDELSRMEVFVKNSLANPAQKGMAPMFIPSVMLNANAELKAPDALGKDFQTLTDKMNSSFTELRGIEKELIAYKNAEDWKDDKGKKITELSEKASKLAGENRNAAKELFALLTPKADKAEEEILKDHPLAKQIKQSREVLKLTQTIIDDSYSIKDTDAYKTLFNKQYQQLEQLYKRNMDEGIPSDQKSKSSSYTAFNSSVNEFLGKMRIIQRDLNDGSDRLNDHLDALESESTSVLNRYNTFVD